MPRRIPGYIRGTAVPGAPECDGIIVGSPFSPNGTNQQRPCYFRPRFRAVFMLDGAEQVRLCCGVHRRWFARFCTITPLEQETR